jgi:hypothetical protein
LPSEDKKKELIPYFQLMKHHSIPDMARYCIRVTTRFSIPGMARYSILLLMTVCVAAACESKSDMARSSGSQPDSAVGSATRPEGNRLNGTWRLLTGTTITRGVSMVTDYTKDQSMIKIINGSHFAFLHHRTGEPKDSSNQFDAGGGSYTLQGDQYTEHLDYYSDKNWEGKTFNFTITIDHDTLIQRGQEKLEKEGIDREIVEKYLRIR